MTLKSLKRAPRKPGKAWRAPRGTLDLVLPRLSRDLVKSLPSIAALMTGGQLAPDWVTHSLLYGVGLLRMAVDGADSQPSRKDVRKKLLELQTTVRHATQLLEWRSGGSSLTEFLDDTALAKGGYFDRESALQILGEMETRTRFALSAIGASGGRGKAWPERSRRISPEAVCALVVQEISAAMKKERLEHSATQATLYKACALLWTVHQGANAKPRAKSDSGWRNDFDAASRIPAENALRRRIRRLIWQSKGFSQ